MSMILDTDVLMHIDAPDDATIEVLLRDFDVESIAEVDAFLEHFSDLDVDKVEDFLAHYGVKGMRWGVRKERKRAPEKLSTKTARTAVTKRVIENYNAMSDKEFKRTYRASKKTYAKRVEKHGDPYARTELGKATDSGKVRRTKRADKTFEKAAKNPYLAMEFHHEAVRTTKYRDLPKINNKPAYQGKNLKEDRALRQKYDAEVQKAFLKNLTKIVIDVGTNVSNTRELGVLVNERSGRWRLAAVDVKHEAVSVEDLIGMEIEPKRDETGHIVDLKLVKDVTAVVHFIDESGDEFDVALIGFDEEALDEVDAFLEHNAMSGDILELETFLAHYGVKGMRWGVRKADRAGVSRKTDKTARKDAQEFARAKAFYGQGAGTRRKLIKAQVESRKTKDPDYARSFDKHLSRQDAGDHASSAKKERKRTDRSDRTKKQAGAVARRVTGEMGTQAAFVALVMGGAAFLNSPKGKEMMKKTVGSATTATDSVTAKFAQKQGAKKIEDMLKNM